MGWYESLFGNLPLRPVMGDPVNPAYSRMPDATAPITDIRGAGPSSWASRPHDQDLQSRNMGGYFDSSIQFGGPAYQWQKAHGYDRDPPETPLPDPDYSPDPSIVAHIRAARDAKDVAAMNGWGPVTPSGNQPLTSQHIRNALQLWQGQ